MKSHQMRDTFSLRKILDIRFAAQTRAQVPVQILGVVADREIGAALDGNGCQ